VGPLSLLSDVEVAAGIPPGMLNDPSWTVADAFLLLLAYVAAFLIAVRLVVWVDVKLNSYRLLREIYRQLGIGKRPPR
jgi:hypothetical protein